MADYIVMADGLYLLGKRPGTTNVLIWYQNGTFDSYNIRSSFSVSALRETIETMFPQERSVRVFAREATILLEGAVSDTVVADKILRLATAHATTLRSATGNGNNSGNQQQSGTARVAGEGDLSLGSINVVNLMQVLAPQQVQLEVRIAEVSRSYLEKIGVSLANGISGQIGTNFVLFDNARSSSSSSSSTSGSQSTSGTDTQRDTYSSQSTLDRSGRSTVNGVSSGYSSMEAQAASGSEFSNIFNEFVSATSGSSASSSRTSGSASSENGGISLSAQFTIEANRNRGSVRMLAEPTLVAMSGTEASFLVGGRVFLPTGRDNNGVATLEAQQYGVGLKFLPTVLDDGRINLKVLPEVSNYLGGAAFSSTAVSTTVEMREGESLVLGGLLNSSTVQSGNSIPVLGEVPILGALFRSKAFQRNKTELVVVITPRLVSATKQLPTLPTDNVTDPSRAQFFLEDKYQGTEK